ncbi:MAG TPA: hypothetical protein VMA74_05510 [Dyella sp.]|uniref:hypothetical protein n=1 Tax=Dyella sp. TaxID=1869338 RepID=UPI002BEB623A|nr:hypothetical protein [Dyella sp.]HUB89172.1 hypothetical protein [Dyella sp.]
MHASSIGLFTCLLGAALLGGITASAQDQPPPGSMPSRGQDAGVGMTHTMKTNDMVSMHGMHNMPATVMHADPKTGVVDVEAEGMALRVHFPPASMVNLKAGDKIGLYMGYSHANVVK